MPAPTPPTGVSAAELDAMFAKLFTDADAARQDFLRTRVPAEYQGFLAYYAGVTPPGYTAELKANVTGPAVVKGTPGKMIRLMVAEPGQGGSLTLNNCATVGAATTGNRVISYQQLFAGQIIEIGFACDTGIVVSAVTTGFQGTLFYT